MLEDDASMTEADIYITPPLDPACSDEDSGGEDEGTVSNLTRQQLEAEAEVTVRHGAEKVRFGLHDDSEIQNCDPSAESSSGNVSLETVNQGDITATTDKTRDLPQSDVDNIVPSPAKKRRLVKPSLRLRESLESQPPTTYPTKMPLEKNAKSKSSIKRHSAPHTEAKSGEEVPVPKKRTAEKPIRKWMKRDMPADQKHVDTQPVSHYSSVDYTPTMLFEMFLDEPAIHLLVENTNKYARMKGKHAFEITPGELKLFIAILFTSGYAQLPQRRLYWDNSSDVHNAAVSGAMTRNRFDEIMQVVHVADNEKLPVNDRMAKVRPLFNLMNENFVKHFPETRHLSIDESMVPYYGRHSAKQFIRGKPIRFGYKVWSLNTPLGYCAQMDPYQGAGVTDQQLGLGGSVVVNLVNKLPPHSYVLYFDNFFTSLRLLQHLSERNIRATGTVRANRIEDCPVMPVDQCKKSVRGTYDYSLDTQSSTIVVRWNDNSVVTLASNCHGVEPVGTAQRWSCAEKTRISISQPYLIGQYNRNMGGVDRMDQNISAYRITIRSRKWWWPLFSYLLQVGMQNAWLLYRMTEAAKRRPLSNLEFRRDICNVYYKRYTLERPAVGRSVGGRPKELSVRVPLEVRTDGVDHYIESSGTQRRCAACGKKVRKQCMKCDVGLHMDCFVVFHNAA